MPFKNPRAYWKIAGVLFTSVVAPLGVRQIGPSDHAPIVIESAPLATTLTFPEEQSNLAARVLARGDGPSPEDAFQNAIDLAVRQVVEAEIDPREWSRRGPAYLASVRRGGTSVLRGWRELSATSERHLTGRAYHSEVAVEVDGAALRQCVQGR
jgi:hypothetical protein